MASIFNLLQKVQEPDVYSLLCAYLYEFKKIPEYSTLCELAYLTDKKSFTNIMKYYEGQTVKIPTKEEIRQCIRVLLLFQYSEIEERPWKECLSLSGFEQSEGRQAKNQLAKLKQTMEKYEFGNRY